MCVSTKCVESAAKSNSTSRHGCSQSGDTCPQQPATLTFLKQMKAETVWTSDQKKHLSAKNLHHFIKNSNMFHQNKIHVFTTYLKSCIFHTFSLSWHPTGQFKDLEKPIASARASTMRSSAAYNQSSMRFILLTLFLLSGKNGDVFFLCLSFIDSFLLYLSFALQNLIFIHYMIGIS